VLVPLPPTLVGEHCRHRSLVNLVLLEGKLRMRKTALSLAFLLLATSFASAQMIVGGSPPKADLEGARRTIALAEPKTLELPAGQFDIVVQATDEPMTWYQLPGSQANSLNILRQPANTVVQYTGWKKGDKAPADHELKFDKPWRLVVGIKPGAFKAALFKNSNDPKTVGPLHTDDVTITVPGAVPDDIDPNKPDPNKPDPAKPDRLTDVIQSAYTLDKVSGIGDAATLRRLAGVYSDLGTDRFANLKTFNDVNNYIGDIINQRQIPSYLKSLTKVRFAIQAEMLAAVGVTEGDNDKVLTTADVTKIQTISAKLAAAMLKVARFT
jgi:hypothetical protein